jgi:transposase
MGCCSHGKDQQLGGVERFVIVADKGFFSSENINRLKRRRLNYIIPLRRNSLFILEPDLLMGVFMYVDKPVKYWKRVE